VKLFRTISILQLILISFVVVTVPLIVALVTAAVYVDQLTRHGQRSVFEAVSATQSSRMLVEHVIAMERSARQYQVLNDTTLLEAYRERHEQFQAIARDLRRLSRDTAQQEAIDNLAAREQMIYERLSDDQPVPAAVSAAVELFPSINASARAILGESSQLISVSVDEMQRLAARAQNLLFWQTMGLIPVVLVLTGLFVVLVIKPMRRLHQAIRRLGDGRFDEEITIGGPNDLRELGSRLEWMRHRIHMLENQKLMFLRHMSHELKTPLTTIREGSDLLNEQLVGKLNAEQMEIAHMLKQNSLRLQKLIEDLLNFSTLDRTTLRIDAEPVAMDQLIRSIAAGYKLTAKAKSIELRLKLDPVVIDGDREKIGTIMDNLISNAVKYSPPRGVIDIALASRKGSAVIDIRDQGPGIDVDERDRIFDAFYQGRAQSSGPVKGSGLGLSIAREFVRLHQGRIDIIDDGAGAHFRLTLPCNYDPDAPSD
jgi:two-component system, NtrC family, sensor histidine kinase GlrK